MVEYLTINLPKFNEPKEYPVRIAYYVMKTMQEKHNMELEEALQEGGSDPSIHEDILFAALEAGAYHETGSKELDLSEKDMEFALDSCFWDYMGLFSSDTFFPDQEELPQPAGGKNGKKRRRRKKA